ncbi:MAG: helix-turn-helix transcriptional regulator [Phycisphaerae bacterium]|nr:helix-turn-helix transcriptional regulator [Phycisphaerae bacterium]
MSRGCHNPVSSIKTDSSKEPIVLGMEEPEEQTIFSRSEWNELSEKLCLSPRQSQVASLLMLGLSDKQISARMDISHHTLRTYLDRMFEKLSVGDRCELIVHIFREFRAGCNSGCP